jgi:hypothetical protein
MAYSWSSRATICDESVAAAVGASACTAAIAACTWNGPGWLRRRQARTNRCPSSLNTPSPTGAVLVGEADHRPRRIDAGLAACLGAARPHADAAVEHPPVTVLVRYLGRPEAVRAWARDRELAVAERRRVPAELTARYLAWLGDFVTELA